MREIFRKWFGLLLKRKPLAEVRPKLFDDVVDGRGFHSSPPVLKSFAEAALLWIDCLLVTRKDRSVVLEEQ
jgi:hypothetical protein